MTPPVLPAGAQDWCSSRIAREASSGFGGEFEFDRDRDGAEADQVRPMSAVLDSAAFDPRQISGPLLVLEQLARGEELSPADGWPGGGPRAR